MSFNASAPKNEVTIDAAEIRVAARDRMLSSRARALSIPDLAKSKAMDNGVVSAMLVNYRPAKPSGKRGASRWIVHYPDTADAVDTRSCIGPDAWRATSARSSAPKSSKVEKTASDAVVRAASTLGLEAAALSNRGLLWDALYGSSKPYTALLLSIATGVAHVPATTASRATHRRGRSARLRVGSLPVVSFGTSFAGAAVAGVAGDSYLGGTKTRDVIEDALHERRGECLAEAAPWKLLHPRRSAVAEAPRPESRRPSSLGGPVAGSGDACGDTCLHQAPPSTGDVQERCRSSEPRLNWVECTG